MDQDIADQKVVGFGIPVPLSRQDEKGVAGTEGDGGAVGQVQGAALQHQHQFAKLMGVRHMVDCPVTHQHHVRPPVVPDELVPAEMRPAGGVGGVRDLAHKC